MGESERRLEEEKWVDEFDWRNTVVLVQYRRTDLRVRILLLPCDHAMITSQDQSLLPEDLRLATRYPPLWFAAIHGAGAPAGKRTRG